MTGTSDLTGGGYGGGVYVSSKGGTTETVLKNVYVKNNDASVGGGGVYSSRLFGQLRDIKIESCTAASGGGLLINHPSLALDTVHQVPTPVVVTNLQLLSNHAQLNGGGMTIHNGAHVILMNTLLDSNQAESGGALSVNSKSVATVQNTIFQNNIAIGAGGAVALNEQSSLELKGLE